MIQMLLVWPIFVVFHQYTNEWYEWQSWHTQKIQVRLSKPTIIEISLAGWSIMGWTTPLQLLKWSIVWWATQDSYHLQLLQMHEKNSLNKPLSIVLGHSANGNKSEDLEFINATYPQSNGDMYTAWKTNCTQMNTA
jgi:hypothetical protein